MKVHQYQITTVKSKQNTYLCLNIYETGNILTTKLEGRSVLKSYIKNVLFTYNLHFLTLFFLQKIKSFSKPLTRQSHDILTYPTIIEIQRTKFK